MSRFYQGALDHLRQIETLKADLAADPTNVVALRSLVRLEVIPAMEKDLAAGHQSANPNHGRIAELVDLISRLHRGELTDFVRDELLVSVR